jgi:hypothetical protein
MKSFKVITKLFVFCSALLSFTWALINFFSSESITPEQTFHIIKNLFIDDTANAIITFTLIVVLVVVLFYLIDKIFSLIYSLIKNHNPFVHKVKSFKKKFNHHQYYELLDRLNDFNPRWLFFKSYKIDFRLLKAQTLLAVGDIQNLGDTVFELQPDTLNEKQRISYQKLRLNLFLQSGYLIGTEKLLEEIQSTGLINKNDISLVLPSSIIKEFSGDLRGAREILIGAIKDFDTIQPQDLIPLYNNLGRISGVFRNNSTKLNYYEKSKTIITQHNIKNHVHTVFPNLIDTLLITSNVDKADAVLQEYSELIDQNNFYDKLNYYNYLIQFYRQKNDQQALKIVVEEGESELRQNLSEEKKCLFDASTLRIKFNGGLDYINTLTNIKNNWSNFCNLNLLFKLTAFKEIYFVFFHNTLLQSDDSFNTMYQDLISFLQNDAPKLIDSYIQNEIKDYEVYLRKNLLNDKIEFTRLTLLPRSAIFLTINAIIKIMFEIADLLESNGNLLEGYIQYLNVLDESIHSANKNPISTEEKMSILNNTKKLFLNVYSRVYTFENHPALPEFFVRLSWYAFQLGERDKSHRLYSDFNDLNISINHFSKWIQNYYNDLKNEFS